MTFNFFSFLYDVLYIYFVIGPDWRSRFEDPKLSKGTACATFQALDIMQSACIGFQFMDAGL